MPTNSRVTNILVSKTEIIFLSVSIIPEERLTKLLLMTFVSSISLDLKLRNRVVSLPLIPRSIRGTLARKARREVSLARLKFRDLRTRKWRQVSARARQRWRARRARPLLREQRARRVPAAKLISAHAVDLTKRRRRWYRGLLPGLFLSNLTL